MNLSYNVPPSKVKLKKVNSQGFEKLWEQTVLPLGNGSLGLTVLGEVKNDRLVLNCKTLWSGGPSESRRDYCGGNITVPDENGKLPCDYFYEIRRGFENGNDKRSSELCEKLVGIKEGYGSYLTWGELDFEFDDIRKFVNYKRCLDFSNAVCTVSYDVILDNGETVKDKREYFVSHSDRCAVIRFTRSGGKMGLKISLSSAHADADYSDNRIIHKGALADNGLKFCLCADLTTDGTALKASDGINITNASKVVITLSADTDYFDNYPVYRTGESESELYKRVSALSENAAKKGYDNLLSDHIADYSKLFTALQLDLKGVSDIPADKLLRNYNKWWCRQGYRRAAEQILYEYGRYLLIASSREEDILPSNLQGIWNMSNTPVWSSDFHLDINLQMNYFHAYNGNTAQCAMPLIRYIKAMRAPGRFTAEYYTGVKSHGNEENGFLFHTQNTPFGWTCPGWIFDWGWSPAVVPWILHSIYEYYEYTVDKNILKNDIYPMLRETAEYFAGLLVEHNGRLMTSPCFSPEHGPRTIGNTYEQTLMWQLYDDASKSADALGVDSELSAKWKNIMTRLEVYEIGDDGQIKEWYHETKLGEIGERHHRHMSHLLGLYPCNVINKVDSPELIRAAVVSLNDRGDKSTGWSMGQKINTWARVGDGDRILKIFGDLFKNSIYPNFWDVCPPFQIDGNFAFSAGVNEMLMQSNCGFIELLPTLPCVWAEGSIKGLLARGNFTVDMEWKNGKLTNAVITSNHGGKCTLRYVKAPFTINGEIVSKNGFAEFDTEKGKQYKITV